MSLYSVKLIVTYRAPGFHCWSEAPDEVSFLRARHRHLFTFKVEMRVKHNDRESEFFIVRNQLISDLNWLFERSGHGFEFGALSCEHIACRIAGRMPNALAVEVWEDDENGARVDY